MGLNISLMSLVFVVHLGVVKIYLAALYCPHLYHCIPASGLTVICCNSNFRAWLKVSVVYSLTNKAYN